MNDTAGTPSPARQALTNSLEDLERLLAQTRANTAAGRHSAARETLMRLRRNVAQALKNSHLVEEE